MRLAQKTFEIPQIAICRIDPAIVGNIITVVAQRRRIERHDPNRGRPEILDVVQFFGQAGEISDAVVAGIEKGFHMQLIDNRVAIPFEVVAIDHAAGLHRAASAGNRRQIRGSCIRAAPFLLRVPPERRVNIKNPAALPPGGQSQFITSIRIVLLFPEFGPIGKTRPEIPLETPVNRPVKRLAAKLFRPIILP